MDMGSFKELLKARGFKIHSYIGSEEEIERGPGLIRMLILGTDIKSAFAKAGHFDALINLFRRVGCLLETGLFVLIF